MGKRLSWIFNVFDRHTLHSNVIFSLSLSHSSPNAKKVHLNRFAYKARWPLFYRHIDRTSAPILNSPICERNLRNWPQMKSHEMNWYLAFCHISSYYWKIICLSVDSNVCQFQHFHHVFHRCEPFLTIEAFPLFLLSLFASPWAEYQSKEHCLNWVLTSSSSSSTPMLFLENKTELKELILNASSMKLPEIFHHRLKAAASKLNNSLNDVRNRWHKKTSSRKWNVAELR